MADERLDFGGWRADGVSYRALRAVEAEGVRRARAVICRTEHARGILARRSRLAGSEEKIFVAPNPKDSTLFAPQTSAERERTRAQYGISTGAPWVVYVGSIGPQYCPELMLDACSRIHERRPDARFSLFTFHAAELERRLRSRPALAAALSLGQLQPAEVPRVLAAADLGLAPRQPHFSQLGISPIKVGEYLLCGTPVVASRVGDLPPKQAPRCWWTRTPLARPRRWLAGSSNKCSPVATPCAPKRGRWACAGSI
jgi:glycosyltransferase involved in cell wall biosynthesis